MQDNTDRRFRRTNRDLSAALIDLTSQRPYKSIQVRDITDRADVGYATFYRHYDSKDDLMLAVFEDITEELEISAGNETGEYFLQEGILIFAHVKKYTGFYNSILQSQDFVKKLKKLLSTHIEEHIVRHTYSQKQTAVPIDLAANHMVVALVGLIEWWVDHETKLPIEEIARIYQRLIIQATWQALDINNPLSSVDRL